MKKGYDIYAIGNSLLDYEILVNEDFFNKNKVEKGMMTLVEEDKQLQLIKATNEGLKMKQAGGSAANSVFALAQYGGKAFFTGKVGNDEDGNTFTHDMEKNGIGNNLSSNRHLTQKTGKCLVLISPDAERTMCTFLGASSALSKKDIHMEAIQQSNYVFLEGFLVSNPDSLEVMMEVISHSKQSNAKIALTFSDPSMVTYFKKEMKQVTERGIDLLFCNEEEAQIFTEQSSLDAAIEALKKIASQFVVTRGSLGSIAFDGSSLITIAPNKVVPVDSTGAGDSYAGVFLHFVNQGATFAEAGKQASAASAHVVAKYGPRLSERVVV